MIKKLKRNYYLIVVVAIFAFFMVWLMTYLHEDNLVMEWPVSFNNGWQIEANEEENTVVLRREITEDMLGKVVYFRTSDTFVDAVAGSESIYQFGAVHEVIRSPGTLWHMIKVPVDALEEELVIRLIYAYESQYTTRFDIGLGYSGEVIVSLLWHEAPDLAINLIMLVLGIILCTLFFLQLKNKVADMSTLFLGVLSICFVLWTNISLFFTQMIFPHGPGQYFTYYFLLFMLPLLLMCYLETITATLKFNVLFWFHVIIGWVCTGLQLSGIAEFSETVRFFLICSAVEMLIVIAWLLVKRKNQANRNLVAAFVVMLGCILINAILYLLYFIADGDVTIAKMGICFFLVVSINNSLTNVVTDLAEAKQSKALRKIAFTDSLTGVGNRYAFNSEIIDIPLKELSLFSFDINNLKYYNDTYGHACGDTLISEAVKMLEQVFERLYRTGGDEFIAIAIGRSPEEMQGMKHKLDSLMREYNAKEPDVLVEVACGYASCQEGDISFEDILRRADAEMYKDKMALKKSSKVTSVR